jgi:hypothetical protein
MIMNDIIKISLFRNLLLTTPVKDILLYDFYHDVINGVYKTEIDKIRANQENAKDLKKILPGVTISGTFKERNSALLINHSRRICIDIDAKDNPQFENWPVLRNTLGTWKEVEFAALSASGRGLFLVVVISNLEKHLLHYLAIENSFKKYGIVIDPSCKDIPRLRFVTYDKDAIFNEKVTPYKLIYQEAKQLKKKYQTKTDDLSRVINEVVRKGLDITNSYKNWYEIGCALVNEYGERGRDDFHRISQIYPKYKHTECDKQYDKCLKNPKGYTKATIFYYKKKSNDKL